MHLDGDPLPRITVGRVITLQEVHFVVGDRLWVRETFSIGDERVGEVFYRADGCYEHAECAGSWKPSIFMPRAVSRLTLTVTDVRVQRLQDISTRDVNAEGIDTRQYRGAGQAFDQWAINEYAALWDEINGPNSWDTNPFVVALTFNVRKGNIDD